MPVCFPHELFGFKRNSVDGMLLTVELYSIISQEEAEQVERQKTGKTTGAFSRISKHFRNM